MAWFAGPCRALMVSAWPEVVWSSIATAVLVEVSVPDCVPVAMELSLVLFEPECPLAVVLSLLEPEIVVVPLPFVVSVPVVRLAVAEKESPRLVVLDTSALVVDLTTPRRLSAT